MIVVDVEASGVDYEKNSIISVGALDLDHPEKQFYEECRVWEGAHINAQATEIHGVPDEELLSNKRQSEADLIHKFKSWAMTIGDRTLAGQNVSFDRDFLKAAAHRAGHTDWPFAHRTIDTHTLCHMHMVKRGIQPPQDPLHKRSALNLDAVLNYCGIPDEPKPHNALTGAMSHAEVISRLLYDKKLLPIFDQFEIPWEVK